jgi:lipoyl(octanoyl) transferase
LPRSRPKASRSGSTTSSRVHSSAARTTLTSRFAGRCRIATPLAPCDLLRLGRVDYDEAWDLQKDLVARRIAGELPDTLILLEHPRVYTLGRSGHAENVLLDEATLAATGAIVRWVDRGGDVTYHGPGQLVGYPIVHLDRFGKDIHQHVWRIEETLIRTLADFGIAGSRDPAYPGVWVGGDKIAAIGVRVSKWVTNHGFALNVSTDLSYFDNIVPCGIAGRGVTSLSQLLRRTVEREEAEGYLLHQFAEVFAAAFDFSAQTRSENLAPIQRS